MLKPLNKQTHLDMEWLLRAQGFPDVPEMFVLTTGSMQKLPPMKHYAPWSETASDEVTCAAFLIYFWEMGDSSPWYPVTNGDAHGLKATCTCNSTFSFRKTD